MNPNKNFIKGKNATEKFACVERVLKHLAYRRQKTAVVNTPPIPISFFCHKPEDDGVIFRYLVPFTGVIKHVFISVRDFPDKVKNVKIRIELAFDNGVTTHDVVIKPGDNAVDLSVDIKAGTRVKIFVEELDLINIWFGLTLFADINTCKATELVVDEVLKGIDEMLEEFEE